MNEIIHIAALFGFVFLIYNQVCLLKQKKILKNCFLYGDEKKIFQSPLIFLYWFCRSFDIDFTQKGSISSQDPKFLDIKELLFLHKHCTINRVDCFFEKTSTGHDRINVEIQVKELCSNMEDIINKLNAGLGLETTIVKDSQKEKWI